MRELSSHAKTIIALINNASELAVKHSNYKMSKDVVIATEKICNRLGFKLDDGVFHYILSMIGSVRQETMKEEFYKLACLITSYDRKLDKENLVSTNPFLKK